MWLAASNLLALLAMTLLSVVMGRVLGAERLGELGYVTYVAYLLTALLVLSVNNMAIRVLGAAHGQGDAVASARLSRWFPLAQVSGGVIAACTLLVFGRGAQTYGYWVIVAVNAVIDGAAWGLVCRDVAEFGWSRAARGRLVMGLSSAGMGIVAVLTGLGVVGVLSANVLASAGFLLWMRMHVGRPPAGPWWPFPWTVARQWPVFLLSGVLGQIVNQRIEFLFLGRYSTPDRLAMYSIAFMVISAAIMIPASVIGGSMPAVARAVGAGRETEASEQLGGAVRVVVVASALIGAAVAGLGPPLVALVYGDEFLEAAQLVGVMAPTVVAAAGATMLWSFAYGAGRLRVPISGAAIAAVADLGVAAALVPELGPWGAAAANMTGQVVLFVSLCLLAKRAFPSFSLAFGRVIPAIVWAAVVAGLLVVLTHAMGFSTELDALAALAVGSAAFLVLVIAPGSTIGLISASDRAWFLAALPDRMAPLARLVIGKPARRADDHSSTGPTT